MLKVWIAGSAGQIGTAINEVLDPLEVKAFDTDKNELNITQTDEVFHFSDINRPNVIINCATVTDTVLCEKNPELAYRVNALGARNLSIVASKVGAKIVRLSTGVPSVGLVTLTMVFNSVGLPVEAIGLIMGIDHILDMARTAVNIIGDAVCTAVVAHQNQALDKSVFNQDN